MWLPIPIYERMPQVWFLLGLMLIYSGFYLGFEYLLSYLYSGVGIVCGAWSVWIFSRRSAARSEAPAQASDLPPADPDAQPEQPEAMSQSAETQA